ncbi:MAG: hypothetical protein O3A92_11640 [Verrucomicrobia bacterium]|nr:hypothetical protein [Verrucomicrobiota bacterium]
MGLNAEREVEGGTAVEPPTSRRDAATRGPGRGRGLNLEREVGGRGGGGTADAPQGRRYAGREIAAGTPTGTE